MIDSFIGCDVTIDDAPEDQMPVNPSIVETEIPKQGPVTHTVAEIESQENIIMENDDNLMEFDCPGNIVPETSTATQPQIQVECITVVDQPEEGEIWDLQTTDAILDSTAAQVLQEDQSGPLKQTSDVEYLETEEFSTPSKRRKQKAKISGLPPQGKQTPQQVIFGLGAIGTPIPSLASPVSISPNKKVVDADGFTLVTSKKSLRLAGKPTIFSSLK